MVTRTKLYINGLDAEAVWGLRLDGGDQSGYDALMAPRQMKEPVTNKNVTAQGAVVVCGTGLVDERTVNVPVHIVANSYTLFRTRKALLEQTLRSGALNIQVRRQWKIPYTDKLTEEVEFASTMIYISMNQYTQFSQVQQKRYNSANDTWSDVDNTGFGMAKFMLTLYESNENESSVLPEPTYDEMNEYMSSMLEAYGRLSTERAVRNIVRNYDK